MNKSKIEIDLEGSCVGKLEQMVSIVKVGNVDGSAFLYPHWLKRRFIIIARVVALSITRGPRKMTYQSNTRRNYKSEPGYSFGSIIQAPSLRPHEWKIFDLVTSRRVHVHGFRLRPRLEL